MTHTPILLLLDALACFRLVRLVSTDLILEPVRQKLIGRTYSNNRDLGGHKIPIAARPKLAGFLSCPWCLGFWLAIVVVLAQALIPAVWLYAAAVLAFSAVAGILAERA